MLQVPSEKAENLVLACDKEQKRLLGDPKLKRIRQLEKFLTKWGQRLHPRNLLLVRVRWVRWISGE